MGGGYNNGRGLYSTIDIAISRKSTKQNRFHFFKFINWIQKTYTIYIYEYIHTHAHVSIYVDMYIYIYVDMYICIYVYMC